MSDSIISLPSFDDAQQRVDPQRACCCCQVRPFDGHADNLRYDKSMANSCEV